MLMVHLEENPGSPMDGGNCTMCHGSIINTGQGSFNISSDVPTTGYV